MTTQPRLLAALATLAAGCATLVHGPYEEVRIDSAPPGATATVSPLLSERGPNGDGVAVALRTWAELPRSDQEVHGDHAGHAAPPAGQQLSGRVPEARIQDRQHPGGEQLRLAVGAGGVRPLRGGRRPADLRPARPAAAVTVRRSGVLRVPERIHPGVGARDAHLQPRCVARQLVQAEAQGRRVLQQLARARHAAGGADARADELGARPKTSWVANRTRACSVRITPDCPAAAGEASAANEHARFRSRANRPSCERDEPPPSPRDPATARACSAALASPAAARRSRVTKAQHPRLRSATQDVLGRVPSTATAWPGRCRGTRTPRAGAAGGGSSL